MSGNCDLTFCDEFSYPPEVRRHFERIAEVTTDFPLVGALLHGSTSRGELSVWRRSDGTLELFSDYEFLLVTQRSLRRSEVASLYERLQRIEETIAGSGTLFHLDVSWLTCAQARRLPPTLQIFEAKQTGRVFCGQDVRALLPDVSLDALDRRELNDVLLWRLWTIVFHFPVDWMLTRHSPTGEQKTRYTYVLCRNSLDLLTWALPFEGTLLPSFRKRYTYTCAHWSGLDLATSFSPEFLAFQERCLKFKLEPACVDLALESLFRETLGYFLQSAEHLLRLYGRPQVKSKHVLFAELQRIAPAALRGYLWSDRLREARAAVWLDKKLSLRALLVLGKLRNSRAHMLSFLYWMLIVAAKHIEKCQNEANNALQAAEDSLSKLLPASLPIESDPVAQWQELRRRFAFCVLPAHFPSLRVKLNYFRRVLGR